MASTFSNSSVSSGDFNAFSFSGSNGIAGGYSSSPGNGLYYSSDGGLNWTQSNITTGRFWCVSIDGVYAVAGSYDFDGIYYSSNSGQTWTQGNLRNNDDSDVTNIMSFFSIKLQGQYGVAGSTKTNLTQDYPSCGIYYTSDYGVNWRQAIFPINITISKVYLDGDNAIATAGVGLPNSGLYYSTDKGQTWNKSPSYSSGYFESLESNGSDVTLAGGSSPSLTPGIYLSSDLGITWSQVFFTDTFYTIRLIGTNAIACSSSSGIYYSDNSGLTWNQSNITSNFYYTGDLEGTNAVAGGFNNQGIKVSTDSGQTWVNSNITSGNYRSSYMLNSKAIVGSGSNTGIYYSTSPICYGENTEILCLVDGIEKYIKITDIKNGDMVKAYKNGYKKVTHIGGFDFVCMDKSNDLNFLFKMKNNDLVVTGGHSILVDELTEEEESKNMKYGHKSVLEDKKLLLSCASNDFEKINDNKQYKLYHIVLENNNKYGHYGIWVNNGILSESCSENCYKQFLSQT